MFPFRDSQLYIFKMGLDDFENHLKVRLPGFQCTPQEIVFVVKVRHQIGKPATKSSITMLRKILGKAATNPIVKFYSKHDGVTLYSQPKFRWAGLRFFPIRQLPGMTSRFFTPAAGEEIDDSGHRRRTSRSKPGVVFAEIPRSGNFFVLRTEGPHAGHIFYFNHENYDDRKKPLASSFESFLDMIWPDPVKFLRDRGGYLRYSDAKSGMLWIPRKFMSDVPKTWFPLFGPTRWP